MRPSQAARYRPELERDSLADGTSQSEQYTVPIQELLTQAFVSRNTRFSSMDAFLSASGLDPGLLVRLDAQSERQWDDFVRLASIYPDWRAMLRGAVGEWLIRRVGIIIDAS